MSEHEAPINEHLVNIYDEGELDRDATIRRFRIVRTLRASERRFYQSRSLRRAASSAI